MVTYIGWRCEADWILPRRVGESGTCWETSSSWAPVSRSSWCHCPLQMMACPTCSIPIPRIRILFLPGAFNSCNLHVGLQLDANSSGSTTSSLPFDHHKREKSPCILVCNIKHHHFKGERRKKSRHLLLWSAGITTLDAGYWGCTAIEVGNQQQPPL